jgi:amidase
MEQARPHVQSEPRVVSARDFGAFVRHGHGRREATGRGVLDGRTFAVKDLIDVAGTRTGGGNPGWLAQQAPAVVSAPVVEQALAAGATLIGKMVTDELAFSLEGRNVHYPDLINPICPDRLPGGSSSGSAVAVAAGQTDFALGTDTGGSVRVPANFLGLFGFRPSHGALSLDGVVPLAPSYDTVGWLARDAALLAQVGAALLPQGSTTPITKLLLARDAFAMADAPLAQELEPRIGNWTINGETIVFGGDQARYLDCYRILQGAEIWQSLGPWIARHQPRFAADIAERFAGTARITPAEVFCASSRRDPRAFRGTGAVRDRARYSDHAMRRVAARCARKRHRRFLSAGADAHVHRGTLRRAAGRAAARLLARLPCGRFDPRSGRQRPTAPRSDENARWFSGEDSIEMT